MAPVLLAQIPICGYIPAVRAATFIGVATRAGRGNSHCPSRLEDQAPLRALPRRAGLKPSFRSLG